jgi:hypothetical protein
MKVVAGSSAETERAFSLMQNVATDKSNSLLVEKHFSSRGSEADREASC